MARTLAVIARYCRRARALGAEGIRVAATSAVRDAANRGEFAAAVRAEAGSDLEIVTGEQEAALSFLGGTHGLDPAEVPGPYLVQDIGGGSTEFVMGSRAGRVDAAISTQMGSVRLTERLVRHDPPTEDDLRALDAEVDTVLDQAEARVPIRDARTLIGVAGTATTLQAIALGLTRYDPDRIHRIVARLRRRPASPRGPGADDERGAGGASPSWHPDVATSSWRGRSSWRRRCAGSGSNGRW